MFCINDLVAVGAYLHCLERDIPVPGRLAICGFNDLPIAETLFGGITTVHSPRKRIGAEIVRLIEDCVAGRVSDGTGAIDPRGCVSSRGSGHDGIRRRIIALSQP